MKGLLTIIAVMFVMRFLMSILYTYPLLGILIYGAFIYYSYKKMKNLNHRQATQFSNTSSNYSQPKAKYDDNVIDVEYTEREVKD